MNIIDRLANGTNGEPPKVEEQTPPETPKRSNALPTVPVIKLEEGMYVDVVPYNANLDPEAGNFLLWLWQRLRDEKLIELYYPDNPDLSFAGFVKLFSCDTFVLLVLLKKADGEVMDTIGFSTLELMSFGHATAAHAGFIFLKEYHSQKISSQAAESIERYWFASQNPRLDVVIGIIAEKNVLARRFMQRIGWTHSGNIPYLHHFKGEQSDSSIWYLTREQFEKGGQ